MTDARVLRLPALNRPMQSPQLRTGRAHGMAVLQGLLVTFLWSTSWVLIKIGLDDLHLQPLSFAGLRYALAAAILLPFGVRALRRSDAQLTRRLVGRLAVYGLLFVAVARGAQFAALGLLPATAVNLVLAASPAAVVGIALLRREEAPSTLQLGGVGLLVLGAVLYFGPFQVGPDQALGLGVAVVCLLAAAVSAHLGRALARDAIGRLGGAIGLTSVSMAIGAVALLAVGVAVEGWPAMTLEAWLIVAWLAAVNTAFAFTIWNHTLRTLTAVESSVVNNTMTIQIAILAVVFLDEQLGAAQVAGLVLASIGALVVQVAPMLARRVALRLSAREIPGERPPAG
jgi:drug/metabolite transporter (DMT)-like permease